MDDRTDDLVDTLARHFRWNDRMAAEQLLAALAAYADGSLLDPNGWRRVDRAEVGGDPANPKALWTLTDRDTPEADKPDPLDPFTPTYRDTP